MIPTQGKYSDIRQLVRAGDVIAFGGKGRFSNIIKFFTLSPVSHVGVVLETKVSFDGDAQPGHVVQLMESTTLDGFNGVVLTRLSTRIEQYNGNVWWLPLSSRSRSVLDLKAATDWAMCQYRKPYDKIQAILSAIPFLPQPERYSKLFCSELVCGYLQAGGVLPPDVNSSTVTPAELCSKPIYTANYVQIKGNPKAINRFGGTDGPKKAKAVSVT